MSIIAFLKSPSAYWAARRRRRQVQISELITAYVEKAGTADSAAIFSEFSQLFPLATLTPIGEPQSGSWIHEFVLQIPTGQIGQDTIPYVVGAGVMWITEQLRHAVKSGKLALFMVRFGSLRIQCGDYLVVSEPRNRLALWPLDAEELELIKRDKRNIGRIDLSLYPAVGQAVDGTVDLRRSS